MTENQQLENAIVETLNEIVSGNNAIVEVRILRTSQGTLSGYFNDPRKLAQAIMLYFGKYDTYFTMNRPNPALLSRGNNRMVPYAKQTTSDADIIRRNWVLIDIDPARPAGISATDEEKASAYQVVQVIYDFLVKEYGWSEPIMADSGNGYHLLFPIDLPNDNASRDLIKKDLQALDFLFSTNQAKVDLTTYNAARIVKLYGTIACKGDDTPERPHRQSKIISRPEEQVPVPVEKLEAVAALLPNEPTPGNGSVKNVGSKFNVDEYLKKHGIEVQSKSEWKGGTRWVLTICPWNADHTNHSAYIIEFPNGAVAAGCHHNSCANENWNTLRDKLEPSWQEKKKGKKSDSGDSEDTKETQAEVLIRLAGVAKLYHTQTEEGWATVPVGNHKRNFKVRSRNFKSWLTKEYFTETCRPPSADAVNQAIELIDSQARFDGPEKKLHLRVAQYQGNFYYDLADKDGKVIEITPQGYQIASNPPNIFRRTQNMIAQVIPSKNGNALLLARHVRAKSKNDEILFVVTVIASFVPDIAHPILVTAGEKGAAKTTTMRMVRRVIDPAARELVVLPNGEYDLALILANNYAPSFDNLESISSRQSDMLCMASTGGGVSVRTLYTNDEETFLEFKHCVGLNGIHVVATRPDLLDRAVINEHDRIPKDQRKEERVVWEEFEADLPVIMGGIFEVLSKAMAIYPTVMLSSLPRMADYCRWGYAIAEAIGYGGQAFLDAYERNASRANDSAINEDPVAAAIVAFMREHKEWESNVAPLLRKLEQVAAKERINTRARRWPKAAHILSSRLKEIKSNLEDIGITFETKHNSSGTVIRLENAQYSSDSSEKVAMPSRQVTDQIDYEMGLLDDVC